MDEVPMTNRQVWLWGVLALAVVVGGALLLMYLQMPLQGTVYATSVADDGLRRNISLLLPNLAVTEETIALGERVYALARVPSPDGANSAYVVHDLVDGRRVIITAGEVETTVTVFGDVPEIPSWSSDSSTIAFSTLPKLSEEDTGNPDSWLVVRAVLNGDSLIVGRGYHPFPSFDGRVFALTSRGVELLTRDGEEGELVIASAAPVHISTPFAVSEDGTRVAWVNPADRSLQVFEHVNERFVPLLLKPGVPLHSMVFSPDGKYLLGAFQEENNTTLVSIMVDGGRTRDVGIVAGDVALHAWRYE